MSTHCPHPLLRALGFALPEHTPQGLSATVLKVSELLFETFQGAIGGPQEVDWDIKVTQTVVRKMDSLAIRHAMCWHICLTETVRDYVLLVLPSEDTWNESLRLYIRDLRFILLIQVPDIYVFHVTSTPNSNLVRAYLTRQEAASGNRTMHLGGVYNHPSGSNDIIDFRKPSQEVFSKIGENSQHVFYSHVSQAIVKHILRTRRGIPSTPRTS